MNTHQRMHARMTRTSHNTTRIRQLGMQAAMSQCGSHTNLNSVRPAHAGQVPGKFSALTAAANNKNDGFRDPNKRNEHRRAREAQPSPPSPVVAQLQAMHPSAAAAGPIISRPVVLLINAHAVTQQPRGCIP